MNGFEATMEIRKREQATGLHIPIIAMTAYAMKGDRERCLAAGMDAYVSKPIRTEELMQAIESLMHTTAPVPSRENITPADKEFDRAAFIARADDDIDLARELAGIFFEDSPRNMAEIQQAIEQGDAKKLERAAHSLKGALGYFSSGRSVDAALALQRMGACGDLSSAQKALAELEESLGRLKPSLDAFIGEYVL
jgi:HPt (histidine-containing phosphotransfer) domain-containing protein